MSIAQRVLLMACVVVSVSLIVSPTWSAGAPDRHSFDIPSKSLSSALGDYSAVTGVGVLVDGSIAAGRLSAPVKGILTASDALLALLARSGLSVRYVSETAFTLVIAPPEVRGRTDLARETYFAAVQTAVVRALCKRVETRPGQYRSAVQLWIDRSGFVHRSELLGSSGKPERDIAIGEALGNLTIEAQPTFNLPQPITVALSPHGQDQFDDCVAADRTLRR